MLHVARNTVNPARESWCAVMGHGRCLAAMQPAYSPFYRGR